LSYDGAWTERRSAQSVCRAREASKAAARARQRLICAHRAEYEGYFEQERKRLKLAPIAKAMRRARP